MNIPVHCPSAGAWNTSTERAVVGMSPSTETNAVIVLTLILSHPANPLLLWLMEKPCTAVQSLVKDNCGRCLRADTAQMEST